MVKAIEKSWLRILAIVTNFAGIAFVFISTVGLPKSAVSPALLVAELLLYGLGLLVLFLLPSKLLLWSSLVLNGIGLLTCALLLFALFTGASGSPLLVLLAVLLFGFAPLGLNVYFGIGGLRRAPPGRAARIAGESSV